MESNSRAPSLEMNEKDKRNGPSEEVSFQFVLEIVKAAHSKGDCHGFNVRVHTDDRLA